MVGRFATPQYHRSLRHHLKTTEPELWAWFREGSEPDGAAVEEAELELLKTTYRLDGDVHQVLAGFAPLLAGRLGLDPEVVLYQSLGDEERNARVMRLGERIHVVFSGDLLDLLDVHEQEAVLAHELAHVALHDREDADYRVLDHLVHRADVEAVTNDAIGETARRLRLHTEVFADAVALEILGDLRPVVSSIVKVNSGLRNVDPDAYLRQARQIVEADPSSSHGWTHPELHVRVACLAARYTPVADQVITQLIDGPDDLDRIDLLGQLRVQAITGRVLASARQLVGPDDDPVRSYLKNYPGLTPPAGHPSDPSDPAGGGGGGAAGNGSDALIGDDELAGASPSVRYLVGALLVDVALVDEHDGTVGDVGPVGDVGDVGRTLTRTAAFSREAERQGVGPEFDKVLSRATEQSLAEVRKLRMPT